MKGFEFFQEGSELSKVEMNELRGGGKEIMSLASGCPDAHHMAYDDENQLRNELKIDDFNSIINI